MYTIIHRETKGLTNKTTTTKKNKIKLQQRTELELKVKNCTEQKNLLTERSTVSLVKHLSLILETGSKIFICVFGTMFSSSEQFI